MTTAYNCACDDTAGNETLGELRRRLMVRLGMGAQVNNPPPGVGALLDDFLVQAQRTLFRRYEVLRTERYFSWPLAEGVRLYDVPANDETCEKRLDPLKISWVGIERDGAWQPLTCGIPPELHTHAHTGRPQRYEIRSCIELWPVPDAGGGRLIIKGRFELEPFAEPEHRTTIDSELVFLLALANAKAHYGQPDANNYIAQLETQILNLVAASHHTRRYIPGQRETGDELARGYVEPRPTVPFA